MIGVALFKQGLAYTMKSEWFYKKGQAYIGCSSYSAIVFGVGSAAAINNIIVLAAKVSIGWFLIPVGAAMVLIHYHYLTDLDCGHLKGK